MKIEFKDNIPHITPANYEEENMLFEWYEKYNGNPMGIGCCMALHWVEHDTEQTNASYRTKLNKKHD